MNFQKKTITDLKLLETIFKEYYETYLEQLETDDSAKTFVSLDFTKLSNILGTKPGLIFGQLYSHLNRKYTYCPRKNITTQIVFFAPKADTKLNCINFPYLASVLADLKDQNRKYLRSLAISWIAIVLSIINIIWNALG